jgi:hypothetical protein
MVISEWPVTQAADERRIGEMKRLRDNLEALQATKALDIERLPTPVSERAERGYNPWSAPLAAPSEPICTEIDAAFHP